MLSNFKWSFIKTKGNALIYTIKNRDKFIQRATTLFVLFFKLQKQQIFRDL